MNIFKGFFVTYIEQSFNWGPQKLENMSIFEHKNELRVDIWPKCHLDINIKSDFFKISAVPKNDKNKIWIFQKISLKKIN